MTHHTPPEHFQGKSAAEHLKDARLKGAEASRETHGIEPSGWWHAATDSAKETAILFLLLWPFLPLPLAIIGCGWIVWKGGRSALLSWQKLDRLHRVIEEERWEIEHHREQEKEELKEMYEAKGFKGKQLDDVVEVLMADDNRLLQVMLEEELGLSLEVHEHPLRQGIAAALGAFLVVVLCLLPYTFAIPIISLGAISILSGVTAKRDRRPVLSNVVWSLSITLFSFACVYFLAKWWLL